MDTNELESRLTPAARQVLNEILEDYRREILLRSRESASHLTGDVREIAVHDIIKAVEETHGRTLRKPAIFAERLLLAYAAVGAIMAVGGLMLSSFLYDRERSMPSLIGLSGMFLSTGSLVLLAVRRRWRGSVLMHSKDTGVESDDRSRLLFVWAETERRLRTIAASHLGESIAARPLSAIIEELVAKSVVDDSEARDIRKLLRARNAVAHGRSDLSPVETRHLLRISEKLATRLDEGISGTRLTS